MSTDGGTALTDTNARDQEKGKKGEDVSQPQSQRPIGGAKIR